MIRSLLFLIALLGLGTSVQANNYTTPGTGVHWDLDSLVAYSGGDVTLVGSDYYVNDTIFLANNDTLSITKDAVVKYITGSYMDVNGVLLIDPPSEVIFTAQNTVAGFSGVKIDSSSSTVLRNFTLEYAISLRINDASPTIDSCIFQYNNNSTVTTFGNGSIALFRASPVITNSKFLNNNRAAIQGGANIANAPKIINCLFQGNNTTNQNVPQINMGATGTDTIKILNCQILQASTNSGGIGFLPTSTANILISGNTIKNNRYGIVLQGGNTINALVSYNIIDSNNTQNNPNLGGSGISFAGGTATSQQNSIVTGNIIRGNLWGITIQNRAKPNLGNLNNADTTDDGKNEIYGNTNSTTPFIDLYNNTIDPIFAENNYWGTTDPLVAEDRIFHNVDNAALGIVDFDPVFTTPLPVKLEDFSASIKGDDIVLQWLASDEKNVSHFNLQRSYTGADFTNIAALTARNSAGVIEQYSYTDTRDNPTGNKLFYRLQIVDKSGTLTYSNVKLVQIAGLSFVSVSPNPATDVLYIQGNELSTLTVMNLEGRVVVSQSLNSAGSAVVDISSLLPGLYMVKITGEYGRQFIEKLQVK